MQLFFCFCSGFPVANDFCNFHIPFVKRYPNVFPEILSTLIDLMQVKFKALGVFCKFKKMEIYEIKFRVNSVHKVIDSKDIYIYIYICMCIYICTYVNLYIHTYI